MFLLFKRHRNDHWIISTREVTDPLLNSHTKEPIIKVVFFLHSNTIISQFLSDKSIYETCWVPTAMYITGCWSCEYVHVILKIYIRKDFILLVIPHQYYAMPWWIAYCSIFLKCNKDLCFIAGFPLVKVLLVWFSQQYVKWDRINEIECMVENAFCAVVSLAEVRILNTPHFKTTQSKTVVSLMGKWCGGLVW